MRTICLDYDRRGCCTVSGAGGDCEETCWDAHTTSHTNRADPYVPIVHDVVFELIRESEASDPPRRRSMSLRTTSAEVNPAAIWPIDPLRSATELVIRS